MPVRNGEGSIRKCIDSLLAQDFDDFEIIVSDNASTDGTCAILDEYAARDSRVVIHRNEENTGQIENVNLVFRLSRGEFFRWIGVDDWLDPKYASRCVGALDADPDAVLVTTYFRIHTGDGGSKYEEYAGERPDSDDPVRRFARQPWFFHAGDATYDAIYSMIRRTALERTSLIRMMVWADCMLAAELSLIGRHLHVPECLAHRLKAYKEHYRDREKLLRRYHPTRHQELEISSLRIFRVLVSIVNAADLTRFEWLRCRWRTVLFLVKDASRRYRRATTKLRRETLGLTLERISGAIRR